MLSSVGDEGNRVHAVVELQEVEAVERRLGVPGEADEHVHVGSVERGHQLESVKQS